MPNHCSNELVVTGPDKELDRFKEFAKGRYLASECFEADDELTNGEDKPFEANNFVPMPKAVRDEADAWYDWCVDNWGTKWGAYDCEVSKEPKALFYVFSTAWGPFEDFFMKKVSKLFPKLCFTWTWDEPSSEFDGLTTVADGEITHQETGEGGRLCGVEEELDEFPC